MQLFDLGREHATVRLCRLLAVSFGPSYELTFISPFEGLGDDSFGFIIEFFGIFTPILFLPFILIVYIKHSVLLTCYKSIVTFIF